MRLLSYRDFSRLPGGRCTLTIHPISHCEKMLRVLHCPTPTGGHSQLLARAERELGLHSTSVIWRQDAFAFPADEVLCPPTSHPLQRERVRFTLLKRALQDYDIVHFNLGQTFMPHYMPTRGQ